MIDHLVGTPSPSWKRTQVLSLLISSIHHSSILPQVFLVIFFWLWKITWGDAHGPRILWIRALNRRLRTSSIPTHNISRFSSFPGNFTPWQIIVSTLTAVYAMRNADKLVGLGGKSRSDLQIPEVHPLNSTGTPSSSRKSIRSLFHRL